MKEIANTYKDLAIGTSEELFSPQRKKPVLYIRQKNCLTKIASFNNVECMNNFWEILKEIGVIK